MSGRSVLYLGVFGLTVCAVGAGVLGAATRADTIMVSGKVTTTCVALRTRPTPEVFTVDGVKLGGEPWISSGLGEGTCTSMFSVDHVARQDFYRIQVGPLTTVVSRVDAVGNVELTD